MAHELVVTVVHLGYCTVDLLLGGAFGVYGVTRLVKKNVEVVDSRSVVDFANPVAVVSKADKFLVFLIKVYKFRGINVCFL